MHNLIKFKGNGVIDSLWTHHLSHNIIGGFGVAHEIMVLN